MATLNKELRGREKIRPPEFHFAYNFDWFRKLRWTERLKLLLGYNMQIKVRFLTVNSAGACQPIIAGELTKEKSAMDQVIADSKKIVADV